jgi:hypothetical protein
MNSSGRRVAVAAAGVAGLRSGAYPQASSSALDLLHYDTSEVRHEQAKIN